MNGNLTKIGFAKKMANKWAAICMATMLMAPQVSAQSTVQTVKKSSKGLFEIFSTEMPEGTTWGQEGKYVRSGGYSKNTPNYIYVSASKSPAQMNGLSIPIRENPKAGEYRYISFAFVKWGGNQVGIHLQATPQAGNSKGEKYDFTYIAGDGKPKNEQKANASKKKNDTSEQLITKGLSIDTEAPSGWMVVTRDLWKDFGDFTLTGIDFLCPQRRDAGFDEIFLARSQDDLANAPKVSPSEIATPLPLDDEGNEMTLDDLNEEDETEEQPQGVQIDWAAQIKAGGLMMYPLYALGIIAFVIALQRIFTSRAARLAPKPLCKAIDNCISQKDLQGAIDACHKYPSTLASALSYILEHINAGREAVSQTAGDIAARDIRTHLSRIYPISVISSLSPLIGLLGTVVGMIEAFGLVALYGDEGGPSILSDSISKALITTAAGLIIAVPAIALYFLIKNRIQRLASTIEVEIEKVITQIYLEKNSPLNEGKDAERTEIKEDNL